MCEQGCDCPRCFAFGYWGLDRPQATPQGLKPPLVSRDGHWHAIERKSDDDALDEAA